MTETRVADANVQVELAVDRTRLALERTQLAWVRTAFALISAGLALDRGIQALFAADLLTQRDWLLGGHVGGVILAAVATFTLAWASGQYISHAKTLTRPTDRVHWWTPALVLSGLVVILGVGVIVALLYWR